MKTEGMVRTGALLADLAVAAGAFGAHGLEGHLTETGQTDNYETAVRYQMWHALAILVCAALDAPDRRTGRAAWCFLTGSLIFAGTLFGIALSGVRWLGAITPLGGTLLIVGWVVLATSGPARTGTE